MGLAKARATPHYRQARDDARVEQVEPVEVSERQKQRQKDRRLRREKRLQLNDPSNYSVPFPISLFLTFFQGPLLGRLLSTDSQSRLSHAYKYLTPQS